MRYWQVDDHLVCHVSELLFDIVSIVPLGLRFYQDMVLKSCQIHNLIPRLFRLVDERPWWTLVT
jgi:hypothetical protein